MFCIFRFVFVFSFCMFCFLFCVLCCCIVSLHVHSCFFSICVQVYSQLPLAFNKHHVIRHQKHGRAVSFLHRSHFTSKEIPWYSYLLEAEWNPELLNAERKIRSLDNFRRPPPGIEPGTSRFVAQCFNKLPHRSPRRTLELT